jgi:hypothetical protein
MYLRSYHGCMMLYHVVSIHTCIYIYTLCVYNCMILYVYYIHIHIHIITINIYIYCIHIYIYVYLNNAHEIYQLRLRFRGEFIMVSIFWSQDAKTWFPYKMANLQNSRLAPRLPCFFRNNNIIKWYKMVNHTNRLDLKKSEKQSLSLLCSL